MKNAANEIALSKDAKGWVLAAAACVMTAVGIIYVFPQDNRPSYFLQLLLAVGLGTIVSLFGLTRERH
jgi:CDP-diglyceride synthetase